MSQVTLKQFEMLNPDEQRSILSRMKNEIGINGILEQWKISRSKYYSILKRTQKPLNREERKIKVSGDMEDSKIFSQSERVSMPVQNNPLKTDFDEKFSFSINMVGSFDLLTNTLQQLKQAQFLPSSNLHISVKIEEL
jgi:predicted DNA-binding protein YlxM (UPF0122 family)